LQLYNTVKRKRKYVFDVEFIQKESRPLQILLQMSSNSTNSSGIQLNIAELSISENVSFISLNTAFKCCKFIYSHFQEHDVQSVNVDTVQHAFMTDESSAIERMSTLSICTNVGLLFISFFWTFKFIYSFFNL
jgi:hypothetical protein